MIETLEKALLLGDPRIKHLKIIGKNTLEGTRCLVEMLKNPTSLDIAEITTSVQSRDGGLPNKELAYVAGISGDHYNGKEGRFNSFDESAYHLIFISGYKKDENGMFTKKYFNSTVFTVDLLHITDYSRLRK